MYRPTGALAHCFTNALRMYENNTYFLGFLFCSRGWFILVIQLALIMHHFVIYQLLSIRCDRVSSIHQGQEIIFPFPSPITVRTGNNATTKSHTSPIHHMPNYIDQKMISPLLTLRAVCIPLLEITTIQPECIHHRYSPPHISSNRTHSVSVTYAMSLHLPYRTYILPHDTHTFIPE